MSNKNKENLSLLSIVIIRPLFEEIFFRFVLITVIFILSNNLLLAYFVSLWLFVNMHLLCNIYENMEEKLQHAILLIIITLFIILAYHIGGLALSFLVHAFWNFFVSGTQSV
ncbi:MAG: CPBP family glutamic-type intramembrane protease [Candidatus Hodarchaeales archaeon]